MATSQQDWNRCPEVLIVGMARTGDREAFGELVRRHQSWVRNLLHRLCNNPALADDLAQQCFLVAWKDVRKIREASRFNGWLKQVAINTWRQQARRNDLLSRSVELPESAARSEAPGVSADLDRALATLEGDQKLCVVLSYSEGMTHGEIAEATDLPLGTVKSHIRRGAERLKQQLSAYRPQDEDQRNG